MLPLRCPAIFGISQPYIADLQCLCAMLPAVYAKGMYVGEFGIVHPDVLSAFEIPFPVCALELDLEPFCFNQFYEPLDTTVHA
jgi:hypothetical protein